MEVRLTMQAADLMECEGCLANLFRDAAAMQILAKMDLFPGAQKACFMPEQRIESFWS